MSDLRDRPVFICGHPKAGTSLLRNLLDSHPQLIVYPEESRFFRNYILEAGGEQESDALHLAKEHLLHIFEWNQDNHPEHQAGFPDRDYSHISFDEVADRFADILVNEPPRHIGDHLGAAVLAYGCVTGAATEEIRWWVEKTPYNEYYAGDIFSLWQHARCIHIVRDPNDNYASYQRKHTSWTPGFFAANWVQSTSAGFSNQRRFGGDRYLILRYEDLVLEQESILERICSFLEIEDHPALRVPTRGGDSWEGNSMFSNVFEGISNAPVGRWKTVLSEREAALIQLVTKKYRKQMGYGDESPKQAGDFFQAWYWQSRRVVYDLKTRWMGGGKP